MTASLLMPNTVEDAVAALSAHPRARLIAGGCDVVADLNRGAPPTGLVSLRAVEGLRGVQDDNGRWLIGAMTTIADLRSNKELCRRAQALGQAARSLGSRQVRNRATVGGNICGGGPSRTLIPVLLAYDATVEVASEDGQRHEPLSSVLAPIGTRLASAEIVTGVSFTPMTGPQRYYRIGPRNAVCYATASVVVVLDEAARSVRVALGGVAPTAVRATAAEAVGSEGVDWQQRTVGDDVAAAFGAAAAEAADPISDFVASAEYRRHAVAVMARRALKHIFEEDSP